MKTFPRIFPEFFKLLLSFNILILANILPHHCASKYYEGFLSKIAATTKNSIATLQALLDAQSLVLLTPAQKLEKITSTNICKS